MVLRSTCYNNLSESCEGPFKFLNETLYFSSHILVPDIESFYMQRYVNQSKQTVMMVNYCNLYYRIFIDIYIYYKKEKLLNVL